MLKTIGYLVLLIFALFVVLQLDVVQTYIAQNLAEKLTEKIGHKITIDKVSIRWFDLARVEGVYVEDLQGKEMMFVESAMIDYKLSSLVDTKNVTIDYIEVYRPHLMMTWYKGGENINFNIFIKRIREEFIPAKKTNKKVKPIVITSGRVIDGMYGFDNENKDSLQHNGFDHFHFKLDSINGDVSDLYIYKDTVQLSGRNITALYKKRDFHIYSLNTDFRYTKHSLEFYKINTDLGSSHLSEELIFTYDKMSDFSDFNKKVNITASLDSTVISTQDLSMFAHGLHKIKDHWTAYGDLEGKVSNFESENFTLFFGQRSHVFGEIGLDGLPNISETFIEFDLTKSRLYPDDVRQYFPNESSFAQLKKFGNISFSSTFNGFPSQFTTRGQFQTDLGYLETDLQFKINQDLGRSEYEGELYTKKFQLGKFLKNKQVGSIDLVGSIEGYGFTIDEAQLDMTAAISRFELLGYKYQKILVDGHLKNRYFKGQLLVDDPNLQLESDGQVDLRETSKEIILAAKLDKANLKELNFTEDSITISTVLDVDFKGFTLDEVIGEGEFNNTFLSKNGESLMIDEFAFSSYVTDSIRNFSVESNFLSFLANGNFEFSTLAKDFDLLLKEYKLKFANDQNKIDAYYAEKEKGLDYEIQFLLNLKDTKPLLELLYPQLEISKNTKVTGRFTNSNTTVFEVYSIFDSLRWEDLSFSSNDIDIFTSKQRYSNDVLASYELASAHQKISGKPISKSFTLSGLWDKEAFRYSSELSSLKNKNGYRLNGDVVFMSDSTVFKIYDSDFKIDNRHLSVVDTNIIGVSAKHIAFKHFELLDHDKNQKHVLSGDIDETDESIVKLSLEDFNLNYVSLFAKAELYGTYTGDIELSNFYSNPTIKSTFDLKEFGMYEGRFGDFEGNVDWNLKDQKINVAVDLHKDSIKLAKISGFVDTEAKAKSPLNLSLILNEIPLDLIEPFMKGQVTHLSGKATGEVSVVGSFLKPNFFGSPTIKNGGMTIEYLRTHYAFDDKVYFKNDTISFRNFDLVDTLDYTGAKVNGFVRHSLFKDFYVDVSIDLNKTLLQNTTKQDNSAFYGPVYASGHVDIFGPFEELVIYSDEVKSEKGTFITIPLDSESEITQVDFIHFVDKEKMTDDFEVTAKNTKVDLTGVTIKLNMNITEDAKIDIIFDEKSGDHLTGYGNGLLLVDLNNKGDFNMYGNYKITKGSYVFKLLTFIDKDFSIEQGSEIVWNGDPYNGKMDVTAKYSVMTNVVPIITDTGFVASHPDVRRANPVHVYLGMKGDLMSPEVKFDIDIEDYPNYLEVEQAVLSFKNRIKFNEQEMNKQVFSLIVLKKLSPLDDFNVNVGSTAGASVSEMFSNQLGYLLSQLDEDLDVYIDLGSFDDSGNSLNVRLSYSVMDGRLRISHNGNYSNYAANQDLKNLFGEWTVEYLLSDDGKVRVKGYNKLNQNTASTSLSSQNSTVYGVALAYGDDYDSFNEFWDNLKDKFRREEEEEEVEEKDKRLLNLGL